MKMKFLPLCLALAITTNGLLFADERVDLLNFQNNDTLHGEFKGLTSSGRIIWKNPEAEKNIAFSTENLRRLVINQGHLTKPFSHTGYVTLVNKDIIPGSINAITEKSVTLTTDYAGEITIDRAHISSIEFSPLGDKVIYYGPFSKDDWIHHDFSVKKTDNSEKKEDNKKEKTDDKKGEKKEKKIEPTWIFQSFAWKSTNKAGGIICKKDLPDRFRLAFTIDTSQYSYPSLILMADLKQPEKKEDKDGKQAVPAGGFVRHHSGNTTHFGTHFAFRLSSGHASLTFHGYDDEGNPFTDNIQGTNFNNTYNSNQANSKKYDLRVDKGANLIMMYSGKKLMAQWDIADYGKKISGTKFGFSMPYVRQNAPVMVKDIVLTNWNGVKDPAITLENEDRDIVMLANGTDRFAGKTLAIKGGNLEFKNDYTELAIPTKQIQSLHLATKKSKKMDDRLEDEVTIRFYGNGKITGLLSKGENGSIKLKTQSIGEITIKPEFITTLDFMDLSDSFDL